ncbi:rod-binding protein [Desulfovibrio sp. ZJ200]|uniref:rod-binding protein n=1 Tax=Desulfovibrio sp. ZJ200 TaxID=2709792 RepID=UPI0013EC444F|nr:rod-binding protein [Desulfovibrio sp. ZJ200]
MSTPLTSARISPEAAQNENARRELQGRLAGLGDLNGRKLSPEQKARKLREACEGFESVFIQKMWQEMRNTLPKGGLLQGREEKFWQDMYDQELSKKMTSAGGIGLADMMYAQLSRNLVSASRSAAGTGHAPVFTPGAAPLLPAATEDPAGIAQKAPDVSTASADPDPAAAVYEGVAPQIGGLEADRAAGAPHADATAANMDTGDTSSPLSLNPPEVEQALAALRAQQALAAPAQAHIEVVPAGQGARRRHEPSGLELARMARREAGTKLGPAGVRPPLQSAPRQAPPAFQATQETASLVPGTGEHAAMVGPGAQAGIGTAAAVQAAMQPGARSAPQPAAALSTQPVGTVSASGPGSAQAPAQAAAQAAQEAPTPQIRKVRYTTNIPPKGRNRRSQALIRTLSTDAAGTGKRAGAGLAAYHAAQAQAAPIASPAAAQSPGGTSQASGQAPIPGAPVQDARAMQPLAAPAAGNGSGQAAGSYVIPPLTAGDLRG